jgi:hypothetical protein
MDIKDTKDFDEKFTLTKEEINEGWRISEDLLKEWIIQDRTKLIEEVIEMIGKMEKTKKNCHTPNCERGTCKNDHLYCEM